MEEGLEQATLQFRQQADGRKVGRLATGKVVLVELEAITRVADGEWWLVRLRHKDNFAIATPIEKVPAPDTPASSDGGSAIPAVVLGIGAPLGATPAASARSVPVQGAPITRALDRAQHPPFEVGGMLIEPENILRATDRVALFVDGANMDHACRLAGYWVDYRKALDYFVGPANFYAGFYYTADVTATDPLQMRFLDFLSHAGFIVRRKPVKRFTDQETGIETFKANLDTEIVLDMLNTVDNYDVAFLFSGDSDFERAVELLRSRGKRVYVVTSRRVMSRELGYVADKPVFLIEDFQSILKRADKVAEGLPAH